VNSCCSVSLGLKFLEFVQLWKALSKHATMEKATDPVLLRHVRGVGSEKDIYIYKQISIIYNL